MAKILFQPANVTVEAEAGVNIRDASLSAGLQIPSTCGGVGSCGLCKVKITAGAEHLSPMTAIETGKLGNVFFITKERLACQTTISGDIGCEIPDDTARKAKKAQLNKDQYAARAADRSKFRR